MYIEPAWFERWLAGLIDNAPAAGEPMFEATLPRDSHRVTTIEQAVGVLHERFSRMARQTALDNLLIALGRHLHWPLPEHTSADPPALAVAARDYRHAHIADDIGLDDLATARGVSRFRISRAFKAVYE